MSLIRSLRFCFHLICIFLLTGVCDAVVGDVHQSNRASIRKRAFYAITGVQSGRGGNGAPPPRLEIRKLRQNNAQWNLYLLALNEFYYNQQESAKTSYYQVAGIHGRPFVTWDNVQFGNGLGGGYCPHSSTIFPTWHRPYLALYEQILYDIVQTVAKTFNSAEYTQAAQTFRIPYWDWAADVPAGKHVLPDTISGSPFIQLQVPTGNKVINNPLFRYHFKPLNPNDLPDAPFNTWQYTLRYPDSQTKNAQSQNSLVVDQVDQSQDSYSQRFMILLEAYPLYKNFSNKAWIPDSSGTYDSLESLHDQIHGLVGTNGGHMAYLEYAAFDPIFWLHHVNVDRLFACWQAIHPNSYIQSAKTSSGTATIRSGDVLDGNTPLKPFHKDAGGAFWTSSSVRNVGDMGYTYPELQGGSVASTKQSLNKLYSASSGETLKRRGQVNKMTRSIAAFGNSIMKAFGRSLPSTYEDDAYDTYTEWIANIRVAQDALPNTFFVYVLLGDFSTDVACWSYDPNLVGMHTVFNSSPDPTKQHNLIVTGTIPLTKTLRRHAADGKVNLKDEKAVKDYLKANLHWRVTTTEVNVVPRDQVPHLKVSVVSSLVKKAESISEFPIWGEFTVHQDITDGRPGGLNHGDAL
ncbi:hypothetical protein MMC22_004714 [Lobaria immixta]|nr:hypothetical protein [Lobaria immixta]